MRRALPTEILLAAGYPGEQRFGTHWRHAASAEELTARAGNEPTWANQIMALSLTVASQEDVQALRTALVALAGRAVAWIQDIDEGEQAA